MSARRVGAVAAVVVLLACAGAALWTLSDSGPPGGTPPNATSTASASQARDRPPGRATRPERAAVTPSAEGDRLWAQAVAAAARGRALEALELVAHSRRAGDAHWTASDRVAAVLRWEDAALDAFETALPRLGSDAAGAWADRLAAGLFGPEQLRRLARLRDATDPTARTVHTASPGAKAILSSAAEAATHPQLLAHLRRFGRPEDVAEDVAAADPDTTDAVLDLVRARNRERAKAAPVELLPLDDEQARERRRLDQIEKLRERSAEGWLDPIAAALAWLALHQGDDGRFCDIATRERCRALGHETSCAELHAPYELSATALGLLAMLDFRDQDVQGVFEPSIARSVAWLRAAIAPDGSFRKQAGYEPAIAVLALGQAARSSRSEPIRADAARSLAFSARNVSSDGGFRYAFGEVGDLSVTGWYVQAWEAVRDAGAPLPPGLREKLEGFVDSTRREGTRFAYQPWTNASPTLPGVGALSLWILAPDRMKRESADWIAALEQSAPAKTYDLYAGYYEVRVEIALRGELSEGRRVALDQLPRRMQETSGPAAGCYHVRLRSGAAQGEPGVSWNPRSVRTGGTTFLTAFCTLTLEHALYRR